jgi:5'-3' exonuclease
MAPDKSATVVLVDVSYIVFYKMFATLSWMRYAQLECSDEEIAERFRTSITNAFVALVKTYRVPWANVVFAVDAPRNTVWRRELLPTYKANRDGEGKQQHAHTSALFAVACDDVIPGLVCAHGCTVIAAKGAEADDVIAVCHRRIREYSPGMDVVVISNDSDFIQLVDEKTSVVNLRNVVLESKYGGTSSHFTRVKVIMGDKSDNIPQIAPKIGLKTAIRLANNQHMLDEVTRDADAMERLHMNTKLIDFQHIPADIVREINGKLGDRFIANHCRALVRSPNPWTRTPRRPSTPPPPSIPQRISAPTTYLRNAIHTRW